MTLTSFWMPVEEFARDRGPARDYDGYSIGVDNDPANVAVAKLAVERRKPAVSINVSRDGEACRVFVQRPNEACFACYKPRALVPPKLSVG